MSETQLFDGLAPWEYEALKRDIAKHGVLVPIETDQDGNVVDGHHRLKACVDLGIIDPPYNKRTYESEDAKRLTAIVLNTRRRHLSPPKRAYWNAEANQLQLELGEIGPGEGVTPPKAKPATKKDETEHASARQREHRLQERIRPLVALTSDADPWLVAADALDELDTIRPYLERLHGPMKSLDAAAEAIRQLAWGPE